MRKQKRDRDDLLFADVRYVGRDGHLHRAEAAEFLEGSYAMYLVSLRPSGADERAADRAQAWQGSIYSVRSENERVWTAASFCLFCRTGAYVHPDIFPLGRIDLPPRA